MSAAGSSSPVEIVVDEASAGQRLDAFLAAQFPRHSRVALRRAISAGGVTVDGRGAKPAYRLNVGQRISLSLPDLPHAGPQPEAIPLDILFEDESLVAINKPAGMVVHPAKGHWSGTLTSALAHHFGQQLSSVGGPTRPGIVHRLDRETSGVIVIAKTDFAHLKLAEQFEARTTEKEYFALTAGAPDRDRDRIEQPIGPHPYQREKMAIRPQHPQARSAETFYEVVERYRGYAAVKVLPKTGRTHQIRLHLSHIRCPVLCDRLYGGRDTLTLGDLTKDRGDETVVLSRLALHARRLEIAHPETGERLQFEAPLPADIAHARDMLRTHRG